MVDPAKVAFFKPQGLSPFKDRLFERVGREIQNRGGRFVRHDVQALANQPDDVVPIVGCMPEVRPQIDEWLKRGRQFVYWDRGYFDRIFATCLPNGDDGGMYRWQCNGFQLRKTFPCDDARWKKSKAARVLRPWAKGGRHIVIAAPTRTYARFHRCESWIADTIDALARVTDRQLVIRDKEQYKRRPIQVDIEGAHCLVTHGSNAAVESVILGCPVFVHESSAAALVGKTDLKQIEAPVYPEREPWLHALSYSQFHETELLSGYLWKYLK